LQAFSILTSNVLRVIAINSVGAFVLFLGKVGVMATTCAIAVVWLKVSLVMLVLYRDRMNVCLVFDAKTGVFNDFVIVYISKTTQKFKVPVSMTTLTKTPQKPELALHCW